MGPGRFLAPTSCRGLAGKDILKLGRVVCLPFKRYLFRVELEKTMEKMAQLVMKQPFGEATSVSGRVSRYGRKGTEITPIALGKTKSESRHPTPRHSVSLGCTKLHRGTAILIGTVGIGGLIFCIAALLPIGGRAAPTAFPCQESLACREPRENISFSGMEGVGAPAERQSSALGRKLPRLRVADNRRFLATADGRPFFWLGDPPGN